MLNEAPWGLFIRRWRKRAEKPVIDRMKHVLAKYAFKNVMILVRCCITKSTALWWCLYCMLWKSKNIVLETGNRYSHWINVCSPINNKCYNFLSRMFVTMRWMLCANSFSFKLSRVFCGIAPYSWWPFSVLQHSPFLTWMGANSARPQRSCPLQSSTIWELSSEWSHHASRRGKMIEWIRFEARNRHFGAEMFCSILAATSNFELLICTGQPFLSGFCWSNFKNLFWPCFIFLFFYVKDLYGSMNSPHVILLHFSHAAVHAMIFQLFGLNFTLLQQGCSHKV